MNLNFGYTKDNMKIITKFLPISATALCAGIVIGATGGYLVNLRDKSAPSDSSLSTLLEEAKPFLSDGRDYWDLSQTEKTEIVEEIYENQKRKLDQWVQCGLEAIAEIKSPLWTHSDRQAFQRVFKQAHLGWFNQLDLDIRDYKFDALYSSGSTLEILFLKIEKIRERIDYIKKERLWFTGEVEECAL